MTGTSKSAFFFVPNIQDFNDQPKLFIEILNRIPNTENELNQVLNTSFRLKTFLQQFSLWAICFVIYTTMSANRGGYERGGYESRL